MLSDKSIQEFKAIYKKEYGIELSDVDARVAGERLTSFVGLLLDQVMTEEQRKRRLKEEKIKGFFLKESDGHYTCAICRETLPGNEIWWNPKGLRCKDCWRNIQQKVIPPLDYDSDDRVWIKEWEIQSEFGIHPATRRKLERQGILIGRDLKREDGTIYCTVYLIKENEKFLKTYKRKPKMKVKFVSAQSNNVKAKTTYPTEKELLEIRDRDKRCVYCGKKFDKTREKDLPTIEHLNHRQDWDSVGDYRRQGKPVSEILAICCMECNRNRGSKSLHKWFETKYCVDNGISYQMVTEVVRKYIDKYEKD
ncbi:MAG: hypothetical protein ABSE17_02320 [Candidatus Levyibacteriota bacterium]